MEDILKIVHDNKDYIIRTVISASHARVCIEKALTIYQQSDKIQAIKDVRESFGIGLAQAKDFVERHFPGLSEPQEEEFPF